MSYTLTLSHDERKAFDWVGDRYNAGTVASLLLMNCSTTDDSIGWDDKGDMTFDVPEYVAHLIRDLAEEEDNTWPCFADELAEKMRTFTDLIV